ncbi:DUF4760 domain-containing protein [Roseateles sp.]|uniref:DUF4760 domain-containing protein n=1 Tax=Roseateles sp. TaxID=1971397 RepID=UPI0039EAEB4E
MSIPFAGLLAGLALTLVAACLYAWVKDWAAHLEDLLKIVATGVGTTAAIYAALNFARLNAAHQETVQLKKLEMTAKFIDKWLDPKCAEVIHKVGSFMKLAPTLSQVELAAKIDADDELRNSALFVLNILEALALQLRHSALDEQLAREFFRGIVVIYHTRLSGLIALGRTRTDNPRMFCELEDLADAWSTK